MSKNFDKRLGFPNNWVKFLICFSLLEFYLILRRLLKHSCTRDSLIFWISTIWYTLYNLTFNKNTWLQIALINLTESIRKTLDVGSFGCGIFVDLQKTFDTVDQTLRTLKYWFSVQQVQSYLMGRRCLFGLGWPPFKWRYHNKNTFWGRYFITSTSFALHLFLLGWLKLNLILLLDSWFWLSQIWPVI